MARRRSPFRARRRGRSRGSRTHRGSRLLAGITTAFLVVACAVAVVTTRRDGPESRGAGARSRPATAPARVAPENDDPEIEILLTESDGADRASFGGSKGWIAKNAAGAVIAQGASAALEPLSVTPQKTLQFGTYASAEKEAWIAETGGEPLTVGKLKYSGRLRVSIVDGALRITNLVALERYLASVVGSEMYANATPSASLEAQAIAARTYARWSIEKRGRTPLPDSQEAQAYYGVTRETSATRSAVLATKGEVLVQDGELLPAFYHSTCGGRTIDGSYLLGGPAPKALRGAECGFCSAAKYYRWNSNIPENALSAAAKDLKLGKRILQLEAAGAAQDPWSLVKLTGDARFISVPMRAFRASLLRTGQAPALPSPFVDSIESRANGIVVKGRGFGHGVGLCQTGAAEMGRRRRTCDEILNHYYPGATVQRAAREVAAAGSR